MPRTTTQSKPRRSSGWTAERKARHAAAIRLWAPWTKSTGPRTAAGKARVAQNAAKHQDPDLVVDRALRTHARYLTEINRYIRLQKIPLQNKLLKDRLRHRRKALEKQGREVTKALFFALARYQSRHCEKAISRRGNPYYDIATPLQNGLLRRDAPRNDKTSGRI